MKKAGTEQVGTGSNISAASWAKIIELDTALQSKGERIGAIIIDNIADLSNDIWGNAKVDTYRSNSAWCENMVFVDNFL